MQDAIYQGPGAVELHLEGHPPDVRLEQLFRRLVIIHELVTGDRPRVGQHTSFYRFANALLSCLTRSNDISERGDRALERAIMWRKPLRRQHKTKKSSALPRTGKLSQSPPAS